MEKKVLSNTAAMTAKTFYKAMELLRDNEGSMNYSDLKERLSSALELTEWEKSSGGKSNVPRWQVNLSFYSIDYVVAGFIRRERGTWYLTEEGDRWLMKSPEEILEYAMVKYREYKKKNNSDKEPADDVVEVSEQTSQMMLGDIEGMAYQGIKDYIAKKDPYEFQDMVAALVRAMGYYTPFIAPRGKDGGVDIEAYNDPLGIKERVLAQVKHMPTSSISVDVVRSLAALLKKDSDVGIIVTSGKFTKDALIEARAHRSSIRLIDGEELIGLWIRYYQKLSGEDSSLMPLKPVYFVDERDV